MVLRSLGTNTIGLKTAAATVQIRDGGEIKIGEHILEGPGEYDIAGVGVDATAGYAVLFSEGLRIAFVWDPSVKIDAEDETDIDGILFLIPDAKQITSIIKEQDPRLVILTNQPIADELAKQDGVSVTKETNFKVTPSTLPAEDRQFILLGA